LLLTGDALGTDLADVAVVAVGEHHCVPLSTGLQGHLQSLTARCHARGLIGLVRGLPSVTTASAGQGVGANLLEVLLVPAHAPFPPPSPPPSFPPDVGSPSATPPAVVVPSDASLREAALPLEPPAAISGLRALQASLQGRLPVCVAPETSASISTLAAPSPSQPPAAPSPFLPYSLVSAVIEAPQPEAALVVPLDREPSSLSAGNCSGNVAHRMFEACSAQLVQPHFPVANDEAWAAHLLRCAVSDRRAAPDT
jgi:hypothetical protein